MSEKSTSIHQSVVIPAKLEEVYQGFVDPEVHTAMTGGVATGEGKVGGEFTAWDGYIFGTYLELEPNQRIVQEWQTGEWPDDAPPSRLELTFEPNELGTKVILDQTNVPADDLKNYEDGWQDYYWKPMLAYFAQVNE